MSPPTEGYSADIQLRLYVAGQVLNVAQIGPDFCIVRQTLDSPPAEAELEMKIDQSTRRWSVFLLDGMERTKTRVRFRREGV